MRFVRRLAVVCACVGAVTVCGDEGPANGERISACYHNVTLAGWDTTMTTEAECDSMCVAEGSRGQPGVADNPFCGWVDPDRDTTGTYYDP